MFRIGGAVGSYHKNWMFHILSFDYEEITSLPQGRKEHTVHHESEANTAYIVGGCIEEYKDKTCVQGHELTYTTEN